MTSRSERTASTAPSRHSATDDEIPSSDFWRAASSRASTRSSASSTASDGYSATRAAWSGVFSSCATSAAKSSSASLRRASSTVVRARSSSPARRLMIGASETSADSACRPSRPPWRTNTLAGPSGKLWRSPRAIPSTATSSSSPAPSLAHHSALAAPESRRILLTTASMPDVRSSAVASARTRSCSSESTVLVLVANRKLDDGRKG